MILTRAVVLARPAIGRRTLSIGLALLAGVASGLAASASAPLIPISLTWLIVMAVLAAAAIRPDIAFLKLMAVAFLLPFAVVPVRLGVQPPIFELGLAIVLASVLWRNRLRPLSLPELSPADPRLWVGGLLVAGLVATTVSLARSWDVEQLQYALKLSLGVGAFYLAASWSRRRGFARKLMLVMAFVGAIQALLATAIYLKPEWSQAVFSWLESIGYPPAESATRYLPDRETVRAVGTAVDPNVLGVTLAVALVAAASLALTSAGSRAALLWLIVLAIVPGLVFCVSRGAWLAAGAGAFVLIWHRRPAVAWLLLAGSAAVLVSPLRIGGLEHLRSGFLARDAAAALRLEELRHLPQVLGSSPMFGVGFLTEPAARFSLDISNAVLWIAERTGLLGSAFYLAGVFSVLAASLRWIRARPEAAGVLAAFTAATVAGLVDHHIVSMPHLVAVYWLLGGTLAGICASEPLPSRA